jgi:hypothetical protein
MCVAVLVETAKGPTALEMWQMEDANPHGAGIAWASGDIVRYKKGLTWRQAHDLLAKIPRPALLHFRWATHGGRARHLSHPFPLGPRALTSRKMNGGAKAVLIHNGVWTDYRAYIPDGISPDKWSDTAVAAYAAGTLGEEILDHVDWSTAVGRASGDGRMDVTLRGNWQEHEGNLYSNLGWQPQRKWYARATSRGGIEFAPEGLETLGYYDDDARWTADGRLVRSCRVEHESSLPGMKYIGGPDPDLVSEDAAAVEKWLREFAGEEG